MSTHVATRRRTHVDLAKMRANGEKIAMLTCYDASFAQLCDTADVDVLLIGDSLGMVLQGRDSTLAVTLADVAYHTACVVRGSHRPMIIADMPFGSFQESPQQALRNAVPLVASGAQMVKIEGGAEMAETTRFLSSRGIPVCGHVGLTPQSVHQIGGYRVQGRDNSGAVRLLADALAQQEAGATLIVLEAIPEALAAEVTSSLAIPTIGIGASRECSGQVLVLHDMLDISTGRKARFVRNFMAGETTIAGAIVAYVAAVKNGSFPGPEHCY
ncbi:MAG: 3-methyl-2-oxobutanoate hydroxymethyltransferase [Candidatus Accumulibacter sp.]|jgi:3-methyl-2-oxobutanoate hydroxymethyltransferase|uniref:3-methyl-2-oxobutanoate hydroxymethyltransferase n=1 Tax=unclassified Candidatus Accumulibacter TaxID=2619054 RepID=UPI0012CAD99F|nr:MULTISPECIES: 3-methyl-2-oxobutanoate hydroxymethyltransferase [unclassified Candidatus Accumulibacter]MQM35613.1 3-methyl-2-oxobutanoate hydroxymethyltransferase [Candidatus Accumulibacter phosphatis]MBL8369588.1 3-methyl-2-oxobutanoate hydroxymethyltransferase [Accumulibacter sp.]MBN8513303.1 3-methyl-2-oxobutanoate hydroxymethyltransferase [Accumulibacter sp.]MBO3703809.1 3-methyl-2-oxobutanoate hydroxymethyltransferase [Accumulibacter sp.]HRI92199.1 3-methyl-2-oxobutanoate hydroxymethyl